jgi:hypothetical protein
MKNGKLTKQDKDLIKKLIEALKKFGGKVTKARISVGVSEAQYYRYRKATQGDDELDLERIRLEAKAVELEEVEGYLLKGCKQLIPSLVVFYLKTHKPDQYGDKIVNINKSEDLSGRFDGMTKEEIDELLSKHSNDDDQ